MYLRETQIWTWILGWDGSNGRSLRKCECISKTQSRLLRQHEYFKQTLHKVSTYLRKLFLNYFISSAFLKHLQSRLPGRNQEDKSPKTPKLEISFLYHATLSTFFKFFLSKNQDSVKVIFLGLKSITYYSLA